MKKTKSIHPKPNLPDKPKTKFVKAANQYVTTAFDENGKQIQTWSVIKP